MTNVTAGDVPIGNITDEGDTGWLDAIVNANAGRPAPAQPVKKAAAVAVPAAPPPNISDVLDAAPPRADGGPFAAEPVAATNDQPYLPTPPDRTGPIVAIGLVLGLILLGAAVQRFGARRTLKALKPPAELLICVGLALLALTLLLRDDSAWAFELRQALRDMQGAAIGGILSVLGLYLLLRKRAEI